MRLPSILAGSALLFTLLQALPASSGRVAPPDEPADAATRTVLRTAGWLLSRVVPDAMAANVTVDDPVPLLIFNDTDVENDSGTQRDWSIRALSTGTGGSFYLYNDLAADVSVPVLRISSGIGTGQLEDTMVVNGLGDIDFVDGGIHFSRGPGTASISIGSNSADEDFSIFSQEPGLLFNDTNVDSEAGLRLNQGFFYLWTNPAGGLTPRNTVRIDLEAPEASLGIDNAGNIGFGTAAPTQAVDVIRDGAAARFQLTSFTDTATEAPQYIQRRSRGDSKVPEAVLSGDNLGLFSFRGYNGTTMGGSRAAITAQAAGNFSDTSTPTRLLFGTTPVGSTTPTTVMEITPEGTVKINGAALNVPDYVFEDDYVLMPLEELQSFIDRNGHLPGIASAEQVQSEGLDLADSQMSQLQKIEELTLYTLQQAQQIEDLQAKSDRLEAMVSLLMQERE
jgi:hypothetical protein